MSGSKSFVFLIALFIMVFSSCTPASPRNGEVNQPLKAIETDVKAKGGWEEEWTKTLAKAKEERKVVVYSAYSPVVRNALTKPFQEKYGLDIEFVTGAGVEFIQKLKTERRAGLFTTDLWLGGVTSLFLYLRPEGGVDPLRPLLILPEVTDPKVWWKPEGKENELPFSDKTGRDVFYFMASPQSSVVINSSFVKQGELQSYNDLLGPNWFGKITIRDPTLVGSGLQWFGALVSEPSGLDFVKKLVEQKPVISRDRRLQFEGLARGKYLVAIALGADDMLHEYIAAGVPLTVVIPREGTHLSAGSGYIALLNRAPHPNAARVFANWLLTKEVTLLMSKTEGRQSARLDVPTDFLPEWGIRKPGVKYYTTMNEENTLIQDERLALAQQIFSPLLR